MNYWVERVNEMVNDMRRLQRQFDALSESNQRMMIALEGMMEVAESAMPDTFFQTDRRVKAGRDAIVRNKGL